MNPVNEFISEIAENISMPDVYHAIRYLIQDPDSEIRDFADLIVQDSMLSGRLLRIANTPFFGFPRQANNIHEAIGLTGIMQMHDLILSCLSMRTFATVPTQIFNMKAFWKYSVDCGIAAKTIAQYSMSMPVNLYFSLGLLHEIGHAAMYAHKPELSAQALHESQHNGADIRQLEQEYFGFDYTQIGAELMQIWQLPELYQQVAAFHEFPQQLDTTNRHTLNIVHLAHLICQDPTVGANHDLIKKVRREDVKLASLPENIDELIIKEIDEHADDIVNALWPFGIAQQAM